MFLPKSKNAKEKYLEQTLEGHKEAEYQAKHAKHKALEKKKGRIFTNDKGATARVSPSLTGSEIKRYFKGRGFKYSGLDKE